MHEGPVSSSQFPDLIATPAHVSAAWKTFVLRVVDAPRQLTATYLDNLIGMVISAPRDHRVRAEIDGRVREGYGHAGSVSFVPAGVKTQVEGTRCPRLAALFVPDAFLQQIKVGGRIVGTIGEAPVMSTQVITRVSDTRFETVKLFETFIKPLRQAQAPSHFKF